MATTPQKQITNEVEARLKSITIINGYTFDLAVIKSAKLTPFTTEDLPACNYWLGQERSKESGAGFLTKSLALFVEVHTKTQERPFMDIAYEMAVDVEIALNRGFLKPLVSDNPSTMLGGLITAFIVETTTPTIGEGQSPTCGVVLNIDIQYKIQKHNPFILIA